MRAVVIIPMLALGARCVGKTTDPEPPGILVAGSYAGTRTWVSNQCGPNTTLDPLQLTVTHVRAATTLVLNDGVASFPATLTRTGAVAITPISATLGTGIPFDMTLAGTFSRTGVTLRQRVTEHRPAGDCAYEINWTATKIGAPNEIP